MKTVAIIQARMGSSRLPGKVLLMIGKRSMLEHVVRRTQRAGRLSETVVATSAGPGDDAVARACKRLCVPCYRGSEDDVLDRYYQTAREHAAQIIVRITADCPFIEGAMIDQVLERFAEEQPDYASNALNRRYARGLDIEVCTWAALQRAWQEASEPHQRAHVTRYLYEHPERFKVLSISTEADQGAEYRVTVDTAEDLALVREIDRKIQLTDQTTWQEVLGCLRRYPAIAAGNRHIRQKSCFEAS